uniref:Uncharacterized protein n=1 Tax=Rhizophora mucronata TaxID=61149 RepID=A0A2P2LVL0_RHIMU
MNLIAQCECLFCLADQRSDKERKGKNSVLVFVREIEVYHVSFTTRVNNFY